MEFGQKKFFSWNWFIRFHEFFFVWTFFNFLAEHCLPVVFQWFRNVRQFFAFHRGLWFQEISSAYNPEVTNPFPIIREDVDDIVRISNDYFDEPFLRMEPDRHRSISTGSIFPLRWAPPKQAWYLNRFRILNFCRCME